MSDFEYCKEELKWFLNAQYKNDIGNLAEQIKQFCHNFCFDDLFDSEKINELGLDEKLKEYIEYSYGSNSKDSFDCDDTHLARVVYFLIHSDREDNEYSMPDLKKFIEIGSGYRYKYRGDTLNTYSTLFGSKNQGYNKFFKENKEIEDFRRKYVTIGNFMLLPALSVQLDSKKRKWDSINTYRGTQEQYRDYFDLFLYKFINKLDFKQWRCEETEKYYALMVDKKEFIKRNFLECYLENNSVVQNLFNHADVEHPYCWYASDNVDEDKYRDFALKYVEKATKMIKYRADKICEILKNIYNV